MGDGIRPSMATEQALSWKRSPAKTKSAPALKHLTRRVRWPRLAGVEREGMRTRALLKLLS